MKRFPFATLGLVAAILVTYALELVAGGDVVCETHGLVPARFLASGDIAPIFSSLFLHDPHHLAHIGGNLVFLAVFGTIVERAFGAARFVLFYLTAGVVAALVHVLIDPTSTAPLVGASGALFGLLAIAGALRPQLLGFVVAFVAINVWHAFVGSADVASFGAHLGGFIAGAVVIAIVHLARSEALEAA